MVLSSYLRPAELHSEHDVTLTLSYLLHSSPDHLITCSPAHNTVTTCTTETASTDLQSCPVTRRYSPVLRDCC